MLLSQVTAAEPISGKIGSGEQVYRAMCQSCHGAQGEGSKQHSEPLVGDKSILELATYIAKSMPEDKPGTCTGDDALSVAKYVHESFYSPTAQARIKPARIELSRLTVRQYQNVVSDLLGTFQTPKVKISVHGLKGEYYKSRNYDRNTLVLERVDPRLNFDFGREPPQPEPDKFNANEFSIRWTGSLLAPATGEYEIILRTEHAVRLWLNDEQHPFIDAIVKSGDQNEYRTTIRLLGGRAYPLRLEYSKSRQGVGDANERNKPKQAEKSSIALLWKTPRGVPEPVPERCLSPQRAGEVFVLQTPFPPDDRSVGYERGTSISKEWDQSNTNAALEVAGYVATNLSRLANVGDQSPDREPKLRAFCGRFAERALRHPLSEADKKFYVDRVFEKAANQPEAAVKRVVLLVLKSPRFLYREIDLPAHDPYAVAARLSFALWDSLPDQDLLKAAENKKLADIDQVAKQAERMLDDPLTHAKLREFFLQWLKVEQVPDLSKDSQQYPGFTPELVNDLRTSLELFLEGIVWSDDSDLRRLLLAKEIPLNGRLAQFYGIELPAEAPFQSLPWEVEHRAGVLTHPYLLANFAYTNTSSPIHRGVFVSRSLLGRALKAPPEAAAPLAPELQPNLTTRERVALQTQANGCMSCHGMINPLGFAMESFDAVGRFREKESGKAVDDTGTYLSTQGEAVKFDGVRELADFLSNSNETHRAFVEQLFQFLVKQPIRAYGPEQSARLQHYFQEHQFNMKRLVAEIAAQAALPSP